LLLPHHHVSTCLHNQQPPSWTPALSLKEGA
jgi:hypothetical protein